MSSGRPPDRHGRHAGLRVGPSGQLLADLHAVLAELRRDGGAAVRAALRHRRQRPVASVSHLAGAVSRQAAGRRACAAALPLDRGKHGEDDKATSGGTAATVAETTDGTAAKVAKTTREVAAFSALLGEIRRGE